MLFGSYFVWCGWLEKTSVHAPGFRSTNRLYSPAGSVLPANTSGASVLKRVVWFAPARHTGAPAFTVLPYSAPVPKMSVRPRRIGRP